MQTKNPYTIEPESLKKSSNNRELEQYNKGIKRYIENGYKGELSLYKKTTPSIQLSSHKLLYDWYAKPLTEYDLSIGDHINEIICAEIMRYFYPSVPKYRLYSRKIRTSLTEFLQRHKCSTLTEFLQKYKEYSTETLKDFFIEYNDGSTETLEEYLKTHKTKLPSDNFFLETTQYYICSKRVGYSSSERGKYDKVMTLKEYLQVGMALTLEQKEQFIKINALYAILGNVDANVGNYLIHNNNLIPIDFGYAFRTWRNLPKEVIKNKSIPEGETFHVLYKKLGISEVEMLNGIIKFLGENKDIMDNIDRIIKNCVQHLVILDNQQNSQNYINNIIKDNMNYIDQRIEFVKQQQAKQVYLGKRQRKEENQDSNLHIKDSSKQDESIKRREKKAVRKITKTNKKTASLKCDEVIEIAKDPNKMQEKIPIKRKEKEKQCTQSTSYVNHIKTNKPGFIRIL